MINSKKKMEALCTYHSGHGLVERYLTFFRVGLILSRQDFLPRIWGKYIHQTTSSLVFSKIFILDNLEQPKKAQNKIEMQEENLDLHG